MNDSVSVQVLDGAEHLAHDVSCVSLCELLGSDDAVEEFTTTAVLHNDVHVAVVDEALVELDDVGVVHLLKNCQFLFEQLDVFSDVFPEDRLDGIGGFLGIALQSGCSNRAEVAATDHLDK